jgi:hypothetical protein
MGALSQAQAFADILNTNGNLDKGTTQVDYGTDFSMALVGYLKSGGWTYAKRYDECTKAIYEAYLQKDGVKLRIITANFMGIFTQIEMTGRFLNTKDSSIRFIKG